MYRVVYLVAQQEKEIYFNNQFYPRRSIEWMAKIESFAMVNNS